MSEVLAQGVGILGAALSIFAYQFKDNRKYFVLLALSGVCFGVHFLLLGAFTGALLNFINVVRGFGYTFERNKKPYITLVLSVTLYVRTETPCRYSPARRRSSAVSVCFGDTRRECV